jgi:hypothetical protein
MAIKANLVIDQGTDYSTTINLADNNDDPIDLEGYIGRAQIRKYYTSLTAYDFQVDVLPSTSQVTLSMSANTTSQISAGRYVYDINLIDENGIISRILEGLVTITPSATKEEIVDDDG